MIGAPPVSVTAAASALGTKAHKTLEQRDAEAAGSIGGHLPRAGRAGEGEDGVRARCRPAQRP